MTVDEVNVDPDDFCWIDHKELMKSTGFSRYKIRHLVASGKLSQGIERRGKRFWRQADIDRALIWHSLAQVRANLGLIEKRTTGQR